MGEVIFPVEIDYNLNLDEMVRIGEYDWVNPNINALNFQIQGKGKVKKFLKLYQPNQKHKATIKEVLRALNYHNFWSAKIEELLIFGAKFPAEQCKQWIIALGSSWTNQDSDYFVPCLNWNGRERLLDLLNLASISQVENCCFLVHSSLSR